MRTYLFDWKTQIQIHTEDWTVIYIDKEEFVQKFRVNENLSLRLEDTNPNSYRDWTVIYIDKEEFVQIH